MTVVVRIYNTIHPSGLARFHAATEYEIESKPTRPSPPDPHMLLMRSHQLSMEEVPPSVVAVGRAGAGTNNIPVDALTARGIPVFNTPGANANAVVELTVAAMIMTARNLPQAMAYIKGLEKGGSWQGDLDAKAEKDKGQFAGFELAGKRLGLIGVGAIGGLVASAGVALGMKVVGYDPLKSDADWPPSIPRVLRLEQVLADSHFVSLHLPVSEATTDTIGVQELRQMREGAVLLNLARKGLVNHQAVIEALEAKYLKTYVCDYVTPVLLGQPQVLQLPHLGASTAESEERCAERVVDQLMAFHADGIITNSVNFPTMQDARRSDYRLAFAHDNPTGMLGAITTAVGEAGFNIIHTNSSDKGQLGYTILDVTTPVGDEAIEKLEAISGVRSLRYLPAPSQQ